MKNTIAILSFLLFVQISTCMAKIVIQPGYAFGFAASFSDSIVYITEIQKMDSLFVDSKSGLAIGTENFSSQMKDYLESHLDETNRTCVFFYNTELKKLQKTYKELKKRYEGTKSTHFIIKLISSKNFYFSCIDLTDQMDTKSKAFEDKKKIKNKSKNKKLEKRKRERK